MSDPGPRLQIRSWGPSHHCSTAFRLVTVLGRLTHGVLWPLGRLVVNLQSTVVVWPPTDGGPVMPASAGRLAFLAAKGQWETLKLSLAALLTLKGFGAVQASLH